MSATIAAPERPVLKTRSTCRACGGSGITRFLELGPQPLANSFLRSSAEFASEARYPLDLYFCIDCSLVQLADVVDPEVLFAEYIYVTGTSTTIAEHNRGYARAVVDELKLGGDDLVVEVASNDGSLLKCFGELGVRILGVEPARNIAQVARSNGVPTENRFFDRSQGAALREQYGPARAVIGNNVLAHVDDTIGFLTGARDLISEGGRVIVEVPWAGEMLERLEYDTVYHEHLCYFSLASLERLGKSAGLAVVRVDQVPVHGGSLRVWFGRQGASAVSRPDRIASLEDENGVTSFAAWEHFAERTRAQRRELVALLRQLKADGKTIAAYGAPAKGNTLLNYCGIGTDLVPYTVDRNPLKVGRLTPGMHIPVRPVSALTEDPPDYLLILAWNFAEEIMQQQAWFSEAGGRFIIPIPTPVIV